MYFDLEEPAMFYAGLVSVSFRKLSPEEIADTLQVSKEYVIDVLQGEMCVGERTAVYEVSKQK